MQNRAGDCRDPTFEHYTAKPYVIGLQDTLFSCGDRVHDFYHVEPQHTCLLDAQSNLVVDWVVRYVPNDMLLMHVPFHGPPRLWERQVPTQKHQFK